MRAKIEEKLELAMDLLRFFRYFCRKLTDIHIQQITPLNYFYVPLREIIKITKLCYWSKWIVHGLYLT
jgi:hypothetical protein